MRILKESNEIPEINLNSSKQNWNLYGSYLDELLKASLAKSVTKIIATVIQEKICK